MKKIECPSCKTWFEVDESILWKKVECEKCKNVFTAVEKDEWPVKLVSKKVVDKNEVIWTIKPAIKPWLIIISSLFKSFFYLLILWQLSMVFLLEAENVWWIFWFFVFLYCIILFTSYFLEKKSLQNLTYKFYHDRIEYIDWFLVKNKKSIQYKRITNVWSQNWILERMFGLWTIFIDTAWSSMKWHELMMRNLEDTEWDYEKINELVSSWS